MTRRPRGPRYAAVVAAVTLFASGCAGSARQPSAADQVPHLAVVLHRVDSSLAERRFAAARQQLKALKADVIEARDAGQLRTADAERVLAAISRLVALLPAATSPSASPDTESPSSTGSPRPSTHKSSRPDKPESTASTPAAPVSPSSTPSTTQSASPTPTATATATPDASPTDPATREASPTASPEPVP